MPTKIERLYGLDFQKINPHFPGTGVYRYIEGGTDFPYPRTLEERGFVFREPDEILETLKENGIIWASFSSDTSLPALYLSAYVKHYPPVGEVLWRCGFKLIKSENPPMSVFSEGSHGRFYIRQNPVNTKAWEELTWEEQYEITYPTLNRVRSGSTNDL